MVTRLKDSYDLYMKSHDVICRGQTLFSPQFPVSSHIVNMQILNKQKNKSQSVLKAPLFIGPTVEGREKEKPLSRHGSPATGLQSSETLSTRDLFFNHRSTSCGLLREWKLHSTTITTQDKVPSLPTTDVQELSYMKKKKTYNRCLVIGLRAPVKVHLTFRVNLEGGLRACGICTNIFDPPSSPIRGPN